MTDEPEQDRGGEPAQPEEKNGARLAATALVAFATLALLFVAAVVVLAFLLWLGNRLVHVAANQNKNPLG
ncbi:hypothetical protein [Eggerthella sinensis]|uniref:hypothetical protein n=1 Tax=Eggerthella sinensis TaxID=242230 RepID=UPI00266C535E|nr:hypothetical protein [Eggerthella sinensis]